MSVVINLIGGSNQRRAGLSEWNVCEWFRPSRCLISGFKTNRSSGLIKAKELCKTFLKVVPVYQAARTVNILSFRNWQFILPHTHTHTHTHTHSGTCNNGHSY
jgi:hypothetical protein